MEARRSNPVPPPGQPGPSLRILVMLGFSCLATCYPLASSVSAGPNENASIVLHIVPGFEHCDIEDPCSSGAQVEILAPGEWNAIYVIVRNYDNIKQLAFTATWDQGFNVVFANQCIPGCLDCVMIGDHELQWFTEFLDCQIGGGSVVVGQIYALPTAGCFRVVQSAYPETITVSCDHRVEKVREANLGVVCVGPGGIDVCNEPVTVEPTTWGAIKAQYK